MKDLQQFKVRPSCQDRRRLSSSASGDRWPIPAKPFFANGFVTCRAVARFSICAVIVIAGSATAVRHAGNSPAASSVRPPTAAINKAPKAVSIIAIVSVNTANGWPKPA